MLALDDDTVKIWRDTLERPVGFSFVRDQIDHALPVVIRVATSGIMHHIVTIIGYDLSVPAYIIWDPAFGERRVSVNGLQAALGPWTHTILLNFYTGESAAEGH